MAHNNTGLLSYTSRISPLARRLVIYTVAVSTAVAIIATVSQLYLDYQRELNQIDNTFKKIAETHLDITASALWVTNYHELQIAIDGLSRMPDVHYVSVSEGQVIIVESGELTSHNTTKRIYPLRYLYREQLENIGDLTVIIDLAGVFQRLIEKFWVILITNGIKTFVVSGFMLWLFHWLVTRHLRDIAQFSARLGISNLGERLKLSRSSTKTPDDFDLVLDGFDRMQTNLSSSLEVLEQDLKERKLTEMQLKLSASVFEHSQQGIMITNANGVILDTNPALIRKTGYLRDELIGGNPSLLRSDRQDKQWYERMWKSLLVNGHWQGEIWNLHKNGKLLPELVDISAVYNFDDKITHYVAIYSDISLQKKHETELDRIAHYDILTMLPNRRLLVDRLSVALMRTHRNNTLLAIAYLDIDGFKLINDRYGHDIGDRVLVEVSSRLKTTLRGEDTLARLGGDEFILLLGDLEHVDDCVTSLNRALSVVNKPVLFDGVEIDVSVSIGVTLYPVDDETGDTLLRHADQAMYVAKKAGKNCYHLFDSTQDKKHQDFISQIQEIKAALNNQEFVLHYQPKVNLLTGEFLGVESLIRWQHPQHGLLPPSRFLNTIMNHPLEVEVGVWVIKSALTQIEVWAREGLTVSASVNVGAYHLLHSDFLVQLTNLLAQYPTISASQLELELLETTAMEDLNRAIHVMTECRKMGLHISLDDFGTGYSSLAYFRSFPVDTLKIDKSFVHDMMIDKQGSAVIRSIVQLAKIFEREIIAEGVESFEQSAALIELGCNNAQGFYIARPMPGNELIDWLDVWMGKQDVHEKKIDTQ